MTHRARGLGMVVVGLPVTSEATYPLLRSFHSTVSVPCENGPHSLPMRKLGLMKNGGKSRPKRLGFPYQGIPSAVWWATLGGKEPQMELLLQQKYCCLRTLHMHKNLTHTRKSG